jgi:hypothetical protein
MSNTHSNPPFWVEVMRHNLGNRKNTDKHQLASGFSTCDRTPGRSASNMAQTYQLQDSLSVAFNDSCSDQASNSNYVAL